MEEKILKKTIHKIANNYEGLEASLVSQLSLETPNHHYTTGSYREKVWMKLFKRMIPKKFCINKGVFIIDSFGNISNEVDLAVYDETYTPYIFNYRKIKFIPIEAVLLVVQCKSKVKGKRMKTNLTEWVDSIDQLKTSLDSVSRIISDLVDNHDETLAKEPNKNMTQTSTRPIRILCATGIADSLKQDLKKKFYILLYIENEHLVKEINKETDDLLEWNDSLNHYNYERYSSEEQKYRESRKKTSASMKSGESIASRKLSDLKVKDSAGKEKIIMSLTFQLNQLLMLLNNPMLFPHRAYAERFTEILGSKTGEGETE